MTASTRISIRRWLEAPSPPRPDPLRVIRECACCPTWVLGDDEIEAADRIAEHRRRCHA